MTIWNIFRRAVELHPSGTAVTEGVRRLTYADLEPRVGAVARFMAERLEPGDRVAVLDVNSLEYLELYFAAAGARVVLTPLNTRLSVDELGAILVDSGARLLVASTRFAATVEKLCAVVPPEGVVWIGDEPAAVTVPTWSYDDLVASPIPFLPVHEPGPDDLAHLYYTSGTTGRSKGVMLTHRNVAAHAMGAALELRLDSTDVWGHFAPMFHLADAWAVFGITLVGGRHLISPSFEAGGALRMIEKDRITITNLIPTMLNLMVKHPGAAELDFSSLRLILSGGAPIAPQVVEAIVDLFGCEYVQTYGMTETSPYLTLSVVKDHLRALPRSEQMRYIAKTGRPFVTVRLKVVDEKGTPVPADGETIGEILARGETVTPGYWQRPEETAAAFTEGWLRTGDLATLDSEGYLNIVDRKKDMIITGGENVYSTEVENILYDHAAILEAAVFGLPDEVYGETVNAAVVMKAGEIATAADLIRFCRERIASYKAPRSIRFVDELPRTGSGKISKLMLRALFSQQESPLS